MINREAYKYLKSWKSEEKHKPLILRGARQVGKSTLVDEFSSEFDTYLKLNLEKEEDRLLFDKYSTIDTLIPAIYVHNRKHITNVSTLLFIDEIQFSEKAIAILRYFYEEASHIYVIAAGSLLEPMLKSKQISFPVGRVEYYPIRPCSFIEFLDGIGENFDRDLILNLKADSVHTRIMNFFKTYTIVGGMPEAIVQYSINKDILSINRVYDSLLTTYIDDTEKYATSNTATKVIRHCIKQGWKFAAETITFEKFASSNYKSREVGNALRVLEKAFLTELVYPISQTKPPSLPNYRKKPKLIWLDTGLVNYYSKIQTDLFEKENISDVWRGRIAEHIVAQELLCLNKSVLAERTFWRRDKSGSEAEIDFIYQYKNLIIPIEVKSGHNSKLKSLHLFMDKAPHDIAIRVWAQAFSIDIIKTKNGKSFKLFNIPFYYVGVFNIILDKHC